MDDLRTILNSHTLSTLRKEVRKVVRRTMNQARASAGFTGVFKMSKTDLIEFMLRDPHLYSHIRMRTPKPRVARRSTATASQTSTRRPRQPRRPRRPRQQEQGMIPSFMGMGLSGGSINARNSRNLGSAFRNSLLRQTAH